MLLLGSNREGLETSPCIIGLSTQDAHGQNKHTELYKIHQVWC